MSKLAQGTQIYFVDARTTPEIVTVASATTFNPGGNPADQIEDTPLESFVRTYRPGLRTPAAASISVNADPTIASHITMHELAETDPSPILKWVVGWSDGTAPPTLDVSDDLVLPETRTWLTFEGYIADFPFDFASNTVVTSAVSIQRSGGLVWTKKV